MCARAARQPWRSRDTASLTTAKNQKSRTGENGRNVSANLQGYPTRGYHRKAGPHGGRVRVDGSAEPGKTEARPLPTNENGRPEAAVPDVTAWVLLDLDGRAGLLELRLDRVGLVLGHALLDGIGRAVDEVLGLLETEAGDRADDLDHLDLLISGTVEDDVERRLLLDRCGAVARWACGCDRHRSSGRDPPLLLHLVLQLDELEDRHGPERVEDRVNCVGCHYWSSPSSSVVVSVVASAAGASASGASSATASASAVGASAPEVSPCASSCSIRA